ncbi:MAG: hypothetical protein AAF236_02180 [Verrucomicrobiota bacterium]
MSDQSPTQLKIDDCIARPDWPAGQCLQVRHITPAFITLAAPMVDEQRWTKRIAILRPWRVEAEMGRGQWVKVADPSKTDD